MIIRPRVRGFICTTAHPQGCAANVAAQIEKAKAQPPVEMPKRMLIIGSSTGYGLSCRIAATWGAGAATVGVAYDKEPTATRTGTAGWYNTQAFQAYAARDGYTAVSLNGDAFSHGMKQEAIAAIREHLGQVDCVVYSIASPVRVDPDTGERYHSVIKPIGAPFTNKNIDVDKAIVNQVTVEPATPEEIEGTRAVMGGDDWILWMDALQTAGVLAPGVRTFARSYLGPDLTEAIYTQGTIGRAKEDIEKAAREITRRLAPLGGVAFTVINKALVTQASSAIPVVPLYIAILYKTMKELGCHEGCIEQEVRLLQNFLSKETVPLDAQNRARVDDWELREDVQARVHEAWARIDTDTLEQYADLAGYREDFLRLFGFGVPGVDYEAECDPMGPVL